MRCIVCKKESEPAIEGQPVIDTPYGSTVFRSGGNYGSTIFDPMSSRLQLVIHVCDTCLKEAGENGDAILETVARREPEVTHSKWDPSYPS